MGEHTGGPVKIWEHATTYIKPEDITVAGLREILSHPDFHCPDEKNARIEIGAADADREGYVKVTFSYLVFDDTPQEEDDFWVPAYSPGVEYANHHGDTQ